MEEVNKSAPQKRGVPIGVQIAIWAGLIALLALIGVKLQDVQQGTVRVGDKVPDFSLTTFEGEQINLSDLRGKVVVLNFWASWCKPCEGEAAELEAAWKYYEPSGAVLFIGADYVDTEPEARAYLKKFKITYPNGPDLATKISQIFRITGVPETYFIGADGTLKYAQLGPFSSEEQIHKIIDSLLP